MLSEELDRQDFEAWFVPIYHPRHMNRNNAGDYLFIDAEIAWTAWKARSAELLLLREQREVANKIIIHKEWLIGLAKDEHKSTILRTETAEQQLEALKKLAPVAEVVSWNHPHEERKIDFRWLRFDVKPGTLLYAIHSSHSRGFLC